MVSIKRYIDAADPASALSRGAAQVARVEGTIEGAERKKVFGKVESKRKGAGKGSRE